MNDLTTIVEHLVLPARERFLAIDPKGNFEREAGFAMQVLAANDYALSVARGDPQAVIDAVANIAAVGLSLNPAKKQAYLIPRRTGQKPKIILDISYIGLLDLAIGSGSIKWGQAELVHAADKFTMRGVDAPPEHDRDPFATDRGDVVGAYVVVKTRDDDFLTTTMPIGEILSIRDRSEAWKAYVAKKTSHGGPWQTDFGEMAKKTVVKRAYKLWPKTDRLDQAIHYLNTENEEGLPPIDNHPETRTSRALARLDMPKNRGGIGAERAKVLRAAAGECIQKFNEGDEMAAFEAVEWLDDPDEIEAMWAILAPHSALRNTLKRLDAEKRQKQAEIEAQAGGDPALMAKLQESIEAIEGAQK